MQSDKDNTSISNLFTAERLSHADLMVTFHLLRDTNPGLALKVRNIAVKYFGQEQHQAEIMVLARDVVRAIELRDMPGSIDMIMLVNRLINRWELLSQDDLLVNE